jgi:hypothetical protein
MHYLHNHPYAADTLQGIGQWWLAETEPGVTPALIQQALDELIAEKKISSDLLGNETVLYFLPRQ